jgi:hypothetical protein
MRERWCARNAGAAEAGAIPYRILHAAEKAAAGQLPLRLLAAERHSAFDVATAAGTLGVRQRNWTSAVELAAILTADEDPLDAARGAVHYAALAAVLRDGEPLECAGPLRWITCYHVLCLEEVVNPLDQFSSVIWGPHETSNR